MKRVRHWTSSLALAFVIALVAADCAWAQARIEDCEKIQAADAYNQCLAKFGPSGKDLNMEPEKPSDMKNSSADAAATALKTPRLGAHAGRHRGGGHARRGRGHGSGGHASGGRKRATFSVH